MFIGIIGWIVLGLITGFIGSKVVDLRGDDSRLGIIVGGAGALIGGWLYTAFSSSAVSAFNMASLLVAGIAAIAALAGWYKWRGVSAY